MEEGRDAAGMGGSVDGAVSGGAASGSAAITSSADGAAAAAAAAALVLATEDQGCPAGWQANPSTKGGKWVTRKGNGDDAGCKKEGEGVTLLTGFGACTEDCLCPQQQQHLEGG